MNRLSKIRTFDHRKAKYLGWIFLIITLVACSDSNPTKPEPTGVSQIEQQVLQLINGYRKSNGFTEFSWNEDVAKLCRIHNKNMADGIVPVGHDGFQDRADAINKTLPWQSIGENVAFNQNFPDPGVTAYEGWLNSPSHKKNIEGNFNVTGIGVTSGGNGKYYFTQIFVLTK